MECVKLKRINGGRSESKMYLNMDQVGVRGKSKRDLLSLPMATEGEMIESNRVVDNAIGGII